MDPRPENSNKLDLVETYTKELQKLIEAALESDYAQTVLSYNWDPYPKDNSFRVLSRFIFYTWDGKPREKTDMASLDRSMRTSSSSRFRLGIIAEGANFNPSDPQKSEPKWPDSLVCYFLEDNSMIAQIGVHLNRQGGTFSNVGDSNPTNIFREDSDPLTFGPVWNVWKDHIKEISLPKYSEHTPAVEDLINILTHGSVDFRSAETAISYLEDNFQGINIQDTDTLIKVNDYLERSIHRLLAGLRETVQMAIT